MDTWTIPPEMRAKYDARFEIIQQGGAVTGDVARALFLKSGLPPQVLAKIWALADMDADGRIDKKEFSIALWLIAMKLKGIEVPDRLPASMLAPPPRPPPSADPFVATGATPPRPGPPPPVPPAPALSAMVPPVAIPAGRVGGPPPKPPPPVNMPPPKPAPPVIPPAPQVVPSSGIGSVQPGEWAVAQQTKLKYTQLFNQHDRQRTGFLTGNQARGILMQTGLPNAVLAQIWQLSDIDTDGRLTSEEFVLAMHLCEQSRSGQQLPTTLPVDLVPPSYRRRNSGARHDSVGSVGSAGSRGISGQEAIVSPPMTQESAELIGSLSVGYATFEDRRRENFEKGQAELERRRQIIVEQQKREQQERERKERDEMLRKQKMRQEQERKRQEELEAERERQRQRTEELEAERKRMQEQKEAARKEMERQRELELQRQRITEMTALKQRTQEGLSLLKRRKLDLCLQVERLSREVGEVNGKMAVQKEEVATAKAFIDGMRPQRDEIMSELSEIKARLKECSDEALLLNQEKLNMQNQLASLKSKAGNKKRELETKIEMARKQLQQLTNEVKNKTAEVEKSEKEVEDKENAKNAANHDESVWVSVAPAKEDKAEDLSKPKWDDPTEVNWGDEAAKTAPVVPPPPTQATMDAWGDTKPSPDVSVGGNWGTDNIAKSWADPNGTTVQAGAISTKKKEEEATKYRAVYKFEARNEDELSFQPGDIIKVTVGEQGEPGWLAGELRGKSGWFPKSYVEPVDGGALTWDSAPAETEVRSTPLDTVEEEPGAGEGEAIYYALYQYNSTEAGDLCFPAGAAIKVTQKNGDWWTGTYNGASGMFPGNYVSADELVNAEPEAVTNVPAAQVATEDERQSEKANGKRSSTPNDSKKSMKKKPEIVVVVANYDASGDGQLNLVKGQLVQVRKKTDGGWWEGEIHYKGKGRKSGWFPASYVKVLAGPGVGEKSATGAAASTLASASSQETSTESVRGEKVKAVYDFQGQQEDELNFVLDEIIVVTNKDDPAWWKGYKASDGPTMEGLFPSNYVEPISGDGDALIKNMLYHPIDNYLPTYTNDPSLANFELCRRPGNNSSVNRRENNQSLTSTVTVEENTYQEIEDLTTYGSQEDSRNGDLYINVADDNAMKSASGTWFHSSVANLYCDIDSLDQQDVANNNELSSITNKMSLQQQLSDYNQRPQSLSLNNGTESKVASSPVKDRPSSLDVKTFSRSLSSQRFSPAKLTHVNYEDILNMIHQNPELDAKEKKRQSSIYELISTEQSYVKDLMLVEKYFVRPMKKSGRVSAEDASRMIANWRELITCSDKILKALKIRQTMSPDHVIVTIGDIIVENTTTLQPYIRFCSRQSQAMQLIQQRTEQDPWFGEICKQFSRNPLVNGLPLTSYLLKPMQRITKYPLLVDKILKNTSSNHPDHCQLSEASRRMAQLCSQINEAVQMVENTERLEWCQGHLLPHSSSSSSSASLSGSSAAVFSSNLQSSCPRIVFNSFTNTLGPRKLLYHGPLVKAKSGKELIGFLFNDFLLLTQPQNKDVAKVNNVFTDDRALKSQYRFYKEPFFIEKLKLNEPIVEGPGTEGLIVLHTEIMDHIGLLNKYELSVRAGGTRERTGWLTKIRQAIANYEEVDRKNRQSSLNQLELMHSGCGRLLVVVQCAKQLTRVSSESQDTFCSLSLGGQTHVTPVVPSSVNPSWNATMQFIVRDLRQEVLCITVLQRQRFSPNEFLGRTEIRVSEVYERRQRSLGVINFTDLRLLEVPSGTVSLRVDLQLFREAPQII